MAVPLVSRAFATECCGQAPKKPKVAPPQPEKKPVRPTFGSGPCAKHPGFDHKVAHKNNLYGRSHRSAPAQKKIAELEALTREILGVPKDYLVGIVPASDTGAVEMAMWNMLGPRPVTCCYWDAFGKEWFDDLTKHLKLNPKKVYADYGKVPDLSKVDFNGDVVFTWNGTTAGVRVPNGDWIPDDRKGITICDATSAAFAMALPWKKLDVTTFSWQKVLGGEAAHGMMILSPKARARIDSFDPKRPLPKIFRMRKDGKLDAGIFKGSVINTVSMLCIEDFLDALKWAKSIGGLPALIKRSEENLQVIEKFIAGPAKGWLKNLCPNPAFRSTTSVCLQITDLVPAGVPDYKKKLEAELKKITSLLSELKIAFDIASYRAAPPGLRIWCGSTIEKADVEVLCRWLSWAHTIVKEKIDWKLRIAVTDGLAAPSVAALKEAGHEVVLKSYTPKELDAGVLSKFDCVIVRSATKLKAKAIEAAAKAPGSRLKVIARAGVGVDNVDVKTASKFGIPVVNSPLAASRSVAELGLAHLLSSVRLTHSADRSMRAGGWPKKAMGTELAGKRMGFVGFGRIGQTLAKLCSLLGMELHAYDPYQPAKAFDDLSCHRHESVESLFKTCTHVSIHCGLTPETRNLIGKKVISLMPGVAPDGTKCGNHIVNLARGGIVDEKACVELLKSGKLKSVALDVFGKEPPAKDNALFKCDGFHGTPHVGANTLEAQARVGAEITKVVLAALKGKAHVPVSNCVNPDVLRK